MASIEFQTFLDMRARVQQPAPGDPLPPIADRRRMFDESLAEAPGDVQLQEVEAGGVRAEWVIAPGSYPD